MVVLKRQKQKLLDAYMAEAFPVEDLKVRQGRVQVELVTARQLSAQASAHYDELKARLKSGLELLSQAGELYRQCPDETRQSVNQVFFDSLLLDLDVRGLVQVAGMELKPEFEALIKIAEGIITRVEQEGRHDEVRPSDLAHLTVPDVAEV